jgi:predicted O-linked N-acetylglucosamine transferase (SPINDLY family)
MTGPKVDLEPVKRLLATGDLDAAWDAWKTLDAAHPNSPELMHLEGFILLQRGDWEGAVKAARRAYEADPSSFLLVNLGRAQMFAADFDGALASYEKAQEMSPQWSEPFISAAEVCVERGRFCEAKRRADFALAKFPNDSRLLWTATSILHYMGHNHEALDASLRLLKHAPTEFYIASNYAHYTNYVPGLPAPAIFEAHQRVGKMLTRYYPYRGPAPETLPPGNRRLRIGFISPDLRGHSVSFFMEPILRHHDRASVEIFVYYTKQTVDSTTRRLRELPDHWTTFPPKHPKEDIAARIRADKLDLLIELAGHTKDNDLMVLQHRAAAHQATYLGYPNTTGLSAVQFRFVDSLTDPPGMTEPFATEKLVRLDPCFICFQPPTDQAQPGPLPCLTAGHVTFGSFNTLKKINDPLIALWIKVMAAVPGSQLLLKTHGLGEPAMQDELAAKFAAHGIDRSRLEFMGVIMDPAAHRAAYDKVDIALDTFPYHGTTTTCEALWMGVPVVTLAGAMHAGRVGVSLLTNVGLPELIARDEDDYVRIAAQLAADQPRLANLRQSLRSQVAASPLCDGPAFCRRFEATVARASRPAPQQS